MLGFGGIAFVLAVGRIGSAPDAGSEARRLELASAWAPVFIHDEAREFNQSETDFNPVDTPVGFFFDENGDLRDNGRSIFRLTTEQELRVIEDLPIYYSLIETRTHFYLNYVVYHALDANRVGHVHDTENVFIIIEKIEGQRLGSFVAAITNAHGFPMIYTDDSNVSKRWASKVRFKTEKKFLPLIDRFSKDHHAKGGPEWVTRSDSRSLKVFISSESHAIYKFNSEAWLENEMAGTAYYLNSCGECAARLALQPIKGVKALRSYALVDLDRMLEEAFGDKISNQEIFLAKTKRERLASSLYQEKLMPGYLAAAFDESEPKANLFFRTTFKTRRPLSDPASLHEFFAEPEGGSISNIYLSNPYLEEKTSLRVSQFQEKSRVPDISKVSFWSIAEKLMRKISSPPRFKELN